MASKSVSQVLHFHKLRGKPCARYLAAKFSLTQTLPSALVLQQQCAQREVHVPITPLCWLFHATELLKLGER
jgi:hypothetical protein